MRSSNGIATICLATCLTVAVTAWGCAPSVAVPGAEAAGTGNASSSSGSSNGGGSSGGCPDGLADCYGNGCDDVLSEDPLNCGACGVSCAEGGCNAGVCGPPPEVVAALDGDVEGIAVDDVAVYWSQLGAIVRQSKGSGAPTVLAKTTTLAQNLALDEGHVYWTESDSGTVARVLKAGGPPEIIATGEPKPYAIAVDSTAVYWTNILGNEVRRCAKNEVLPQTLVGQTWNPLSLAVDADAVYWTNGVDGAEVGRIPKTGGAAVALFAVNAFAGSLAVDGSDVYVWIGVDSSYSSAQIRRGSKSGGPMKVVTPLESKWNAKITLDSTNVYWCSSGLGNLLKKAPKEGGAPVALASGDYECANIVVDDTHVYWTDRGYHRVMRTPK